MSSLFGPSAPSAPNPYQVATAQTASNIGTAVAGSRLNNVNQVTPYGSVNYQYQPSKTNIGGTNVPQITQTTTLNPQQQAILNQQQGLTLQTGGLASQLEGAVPTTAMNFNNAPAMPGVSAVNPSALPDPNALPAPGAMPTLQAQPQVGQVAADARNAVYQQQAMYLDPQFNLQEKQLHDSLQDQGIPAGSEAYNQAMDQFGRQKTFAYQSATDSAIKQGYDVAQQQFNQGLLANQQGWQQGMTEQGTGFQQGMDLATTRYGQGLQNAQTQFNQGLAANQNQFTQGLQARQQGVGEASTLYNQPISTLGSLMAAYGGGNVQAPQASPYPSAVQPTSISDAFAPQQAAYANQANKYSADVGGMSSLASMIALSQMK